MAAGSSCGGTPSRIQFSYRPYVITVPQVGLTPFEDSSTPAIVTTTGSTNPTTASFSPPAGSLLLALVGGGYGTKPTSAVVTDTGSHIWSVGSIDAGTTTSGGVALLAYTYLMSAPGAIMVSATFANLSGGALLALRVLNNCSPSQFGAGNAISEQVANSTVSTVSIVTTTPGSAVYGITDERNNSSVTFTPNGATSVLPSGGSYVDTTDVIELIAWKASALTSVPGATTLGGSFSAAVGTATAALEILPLAAPTLSLFPPTVRVLSQAGARAAIF